ncbi:unnamed protein product [Effrenium voratum]|nr:unnamed protein product [Effrenium voratum]
MSGNVPVLTVELGRERPTARPSTPRLARPATPQRTRTCFGGGTWGTALAQTRERLGQAKAEARPARKSRDGGKCHQGYPALQKSDARATPSPARPPCSQRSPRSSKGSEPGKEPTQPPEVEHQRHKRLSSPSPRPVATIGPNGRPPTMVERSQAWQAYREEKLQALRNKCQQQIGSFSPQLFKPVRSPRWLAGPEGGGTLHDRGMRQMARRALEKRQYEEVQLEEELKQCPFTPRLTSWDRHSASPSPQKPLRTVVSLLATEERPCPHGHVTAERASHFYEQQRAWLQAKEDEKREMRKEHIFRALQEEAEVRKRDCSPKFGKRAMPSSLYYRQVAWMRQRELELEAQRQAQFEATTGRDATPRPRDGAELEPTDIHGPKLGSYPVPMTPSDPRPCAFPFQRIQTVLSRRKRPSSAPATPQEFKAGAAILEKLRSSRYAEEELPPLPRRQQTERIGLWTRMGDRHGMAICTTCSRLCPQSAPFCLHCGQMVSSPGGLDQTAEFGHPAGGPDA